MKNLSKHAEWLSLIEISGPFLTVSMLDKAFPQGLEAVETPRRQKLRAAYEEWREAVDQEDRLLPELHLEWVRLVLTEMLEYDQESLIHAGDWPDELPSVSSQEHAGTFKPDWIVRSPADGKSRLFITVLPPDTDLESVQRGDGWPVSLQERMTLLCRAHDVRVGLLTDGERWMLVNAPVGSISSQASWYARLWFQEPITLKAFQSLLGVRRCFGPAEDTLESLLDESLKHHEEVTDTLGEQVRRAVEVLVQCLDKADEDRNRELLRDVKPAELYEAGLTVMMRLVFVLCAEERGLLLLGDSVYDRCYSVSTLRGQLAEEADRHGPEVLDRRHDAWARLLAVFRAVFGGIEHESLRMPALGGSLFDPDRFPFLEGRAKGTRWRDTSAAPLPIDNRTVLLLLNSLQILEQSGGALLLSYRALNVEQIGHVYEGLLEHTVARVPRVTLGLQGSQKAKNPNVALAELESARLDGETALVKLVLEVTGRSESAIRNGLSKPADDTVFGRVLGVCGGDTELAERIRPFTNLLRTDAWDDPIVYRDNSIMVTLGADRRETGTHYTPKSLTESIVTTTLEPVVYVGPAEGKPREEWTLKSSREILDLKVCDPAMGSGAFLVQACRYLGEKLVEAWLHEEAAGKAITVDGEALDQLGAEEPLPSQLDERLTIARRLVAERCLYGVDVNPLAVELAKLSIWLVTLAKGRPFGFLDHNLRSGDSLLGIHRLEQLTKFSLHPKKRQTISIFASNIEAVVKDAVALRKQLRDTQIRDILDVQCMERLDQQARQKLEHIEQIADAMIGEALASGGKERALNKAMSNLSIWAATYIEGDKETGRKIIAEARKALSIDLPAGQPPRKPFHWALEYPEVFERGGFDGVVGNPPFVKGHYISRYLGESYRTAIVISLCEGAAGLADLVAFFFTRVFNLLKNNRTFGLLSTNSITDGDTNKVALDANAKNNLTVYRTEKDIHWPGNAGVFVTIVWAIKGTWKNKFIINGKAGEAISPQLTEGIKDEYHDLIQNNAIAFNGSYLLGDGFVIDDEMVIKWKYNNEQYENVLLPYINGKELFTYPDIVPRRWAISFWDWPLEKVKKYERAYLHIASSVKPIRDKVNRERRRKLWWIHAENNPGLYHALGFGKQFCKHPNGYEPDRIGPKFVICKAKTSSTWAFAIMPPKMLFDQTIVVITVASYSLFSLLQSSIHEVWAIRRGSSLKGDMSYTTSTVFETFPQCVSTEQLDSVAKKYIKLRREVMISYDLGLTKLFNLIHSSGEDSDHIVKLRELHIEMDQAVTAAYGWNNDLDLDHGFHETAQGIRFTISEEARHEILQRLLKLNHERYKEEVAQGSLDKKKTKNGSTPHKKTKSPAEHGGNLDLFNFMNVSPKESK
jgi:Eco57I restriction-modification methylase